MKISLIRRAAARLDFDGELIAEASSDDGIRDRWTELFLFTRTDTDGYVLSTVGKSRIPFEDDLCNAVACVLPEDVARALLKSDSSSGERRYYMPTIGLRLLVEAIDADPRLAVLDEAVEDLV